MCTHARNSLLPTRDGIQRLAAARRKPPVHLRTKRCAPCNARRLHATLHTYAINSDGRLQAAARLQEGFGLHAQTRLQGDRAFLIGSAGRVEPPQSTELRRP